MPQLRLYLLGSPQIELKGEPIQTGLRKASALLIYLAVTRQAYNRDVLAALLWPDNSQAEARGNLRRALYRLNQGLQATAIAVDGEMLQFDPALERWIDIEQFLEIAVSVMPGGQTAEQTDRLSDGEVLEPKTLDRLEQAVNLYRGDFLAGFSLPDAPAFDEWVFFEADHLRQVYSRMLAQLAAGYQDNRDLPRAIEHARRWLALDNLHETAHRRLMELYALAGQTAAALRQYDECARLLEENFGLQPDAKTQALHQAVQTRRFPPPAAGQSHAPASQTARLPAAATAAPPIQYTRSEDVHIAYQVTGSGPLDILLISGFVSHLEQLWLEPGLAGFFHELSQQARLILFDKRGVGLSDRVGYPPTLDHTMEDILAVLQAAGSDRPVIMGVSEGGPAAILFAASHPERVSGLILYGTMPRFSRAPGYPWALDDDQWERWLAYLEENWGEPVSLEAFAPSRAAEPAFRRWWATLLRSGSSPGGVRSVIDVARSIDVRPALPSIAAPALVLHRTDDRMIFVGGARYMAERLPNARLVEQPGDDHWWWVGDAAGLLAEITHFLDTLQAPRLFPRVLATILALDPAQGSDPRACRQMFLQEVELLRGRTWEQDQPPYLAAFDSASRAAACARGLGSLVRMRSQPVRLSLHTGECELSGETVHGQAVDETRQILQNARPGSVVISGTVRDIIAGAAFEFTPYGELELAGGRRLALFTLAHSGGQR